MKFAKEAFAAFLHIQNVFSDYINVAMQIKLLPDIYHRAGVFANV